MSITLKKIYVFYFIFIFIVSIILDLITKNNYSKSVEILISLIGLPYFILQGIISDFIINPFLKNIVCILIFLSPMLFYKYCLSRWSCN